jgi:hypothetical protein
MKPSLSALLACVIAVPALAQDAAADWDLTNNARTRLMVAHVQFNNGLAIATRCADGGFEAVIAGLPPAGEAASRPLKIAFGDEPLHETRWTVATEDTVAVAELPAPFARKLREGGRFRVLVPNAAADGRNLMYDVQLPASSGSIDQTLTTCERPLVDPRDAELDALEEDGVPPNLGWLARPAARFPRTTYARGFAVVTCISNPDGTLRACEIESEHPREGRFGEAALTAARRARLRNLADPSAPVPTGRIAYKTAFVVQGYERPEDRQRRRDNREAERREREARRSTGG